MDRPSGGKRNHGMMVLFQGQEVSPFCFFRRFSPPPRACSRQTLPQYFNFPSSHASNAVCIKSAKVLSPNTKSPPTSCQRRPFVPLRPGRKGDPIRPRRTKVPDFLAGRQHGEISPRPSTLLLERPSGQRAGHALESANSHGWSPKGRGRWWERSPQTSEGIAGQRYCFGGLPAEDRPPAFGSSRL